jgi:predicted kinase
MNKKLMIIMRGLPGSGKSTLAKELVGDTGVICSSDFYMIGKDGEYKYDPDRLPETHAACQRAAEAACKHQISPVIIDNTNLSDWSTIAYKQMAHSYGYDVEYQEPKTPWAKDPAICAEKCKHAVPEVSIRKMLQFWEKHL